MALAPLLKQLLFLLAVVISSSSAKHRSLSYYVSTAKTLDIARFANESLLNSSLTQSASDAAPVTPITDEITHEPFQPTDWFCLDTYLSTSGKFNKRRRSLPGLRKTTKIRNLPPRPTRECKCLMNIHCDSHNLRPLIWLRCYEIENIAWLKTLENILADGTYVRNATKNSKQSTHACLQDPERPFQPQLWLDFVDISVPFHSSVFDLIQRFGTASHIELSSLTLRNCSLETVPDFITNPFYNGKPFASSLQTLNLTRNILKRVRSEQFSSFRKLETLDLSRNSIDDMNLKNLSTLRRLDLSNNQLSKLSREDLPSQMFNAKYALFLEWNRWDCNDPSLKWFIDFVVGESDSRFKTREPECQFPPRAQMFPFSIWRSIEGNRLCDQCNCTIDEKYALNGHAYVTVNCSSIGLTHLPPNLPKNTKIVDASNNKIHSLSGISGSERWDEVRKLYIQNNYLDALDGLEDLSSLVLVDFSGNLIKEIPRFILSRLNRNLKPNLDTMRIGRNPYSCSCDSMSSHEWLIENSNRVLDIHEVRCGELRPELADLESSLDIKIDPEFHHKRIVQLSKKLVCRVKQIVAPMLILNIVLGVSIILILLKLTYDWIWQRRTGKLPRFFKINL